MRIKHAIAATFALTMPVGIASAQTAVDDVVVMRRPIAVPKPDGLYHWVVGEYGSPTPACSSQATRTRAVECRRRGSTVAVDESRCDPLSPDRKTVDGPFEYYGGCGYQGEYEATSATCVANAPTGSAGTKAAVLTKCLRSDGLDVTDANRSGGYAHCAAEGGVACTLGYTATYATYSACTRGADGVGRQTAQPATCTRSDGAPATASSCPADTRTCTPPPATSKCGPFQTGKTVSGGGSSLSSYTFPNVVTNTLAQAKCDELATAKAQTAKACVIYHTEYNYTRTTVYLYGGGTIANETRFPSASHSLAATCTPQ